MMTWERKNIMQKNRPSLSEAINVLQEHLLSDPSYRLTWQANIAMSLRDSISSNPYLTLHEQVNEAADCFLKNLCMGYSPKP